MRAKCGKSGRQSAKRLPHLLALTDPDRAPDPHAALARLPRGAGLIWRTYQTKTSRAALVSLAQAARRKHVALFVAVAERKNPRPANVGEHLPEFRLKAPCTEKKYVRDRREPRGTPVTAAAHSAPAVIAAARAGVDAVLISPVFATASHASVRPLGVTRFAALATLAHSLELGVYALGGVTEKAQMRRLRGSKPTGYAGIGIFKRLSSMRNPPGYS